MSTVLALNMTNIIPEMGEDMLVQDYTYYQSSMAANSFNFDAGYETAGLSYMRQNRQNGDYRPVDNQSYACQIMQANNEDFSNSRSFSLKRPFSRISTQTYSGESMSLAKDELTDNIKPKINQDPQLLSFVRLRDDHTLFDSQDRVQRVTLTAQLHGMLCYRRNLFQISGIVLLPRGDLFHITENGQKVSLVSMEVKVSATESVDKKTVKLIVIPWKTPPPNSPEVASGHEREPTAIPLTAYKPSSFSGSENSGGTNSSSMICSPIAYRRLQFRIATANNGRRRELQQHFTLHLNVVGTLANGSQINICETSTAPIVVRGRSPRNFQARKGIPLIGSSSSRGNPPELQMAMNLMASNAMSDDAIKDKIPDIVDPKIEIPKSDFNFDSSKISGSPSVIRLA